MSCLDKSETRPQVEAGCSGKGADALLACEAGVPYPSAVHHAPDMDPFAEWLSLMEVVHMLCPVWPARASAKPMLGSHWLM